MIQRSYYKFYYPNFLLQIMADLLSKNKRQALKELQKMVVRMSKIKRK